MYARAPFAKSGSKNKSNKLDIPDIHEDSIQELREAFDLFDIQRVGEISLSELVDSMQSLGFHDKNPMMFEMMLKMSAKRKGGSTTFVQFAEDLALLIRDVHQEKDLRMVFDMLDEKHTGRINLEDFKKVATSFGDTSSDAELLEMLDTAKQLDPDSLGDTDEISNEVSFHDFYNLMTRGKATTAANTAAMTPTADGSNADEERPGSAATSPAFSASNRSMKMLLSPLRKPN